MLRFKFVSILSLSSKRPLFWVGGLAVDLETCQVHRVSLTCVLVDLDDSEGREAVVTQLIAVLSWVDSPGRNATRSADRRESRLVVQVTLALVKGRPADQIVGAFEAPARHDGCTFLHGGKVSEGVAGREQTPAEHQLQTEERVWGVSRRGKCLGGAEADSVTGTTLLEGGCERPNLLPLVVRVGPRFRVAECAKVV